MTPSGSRKLGDDAGFTLIELMVTVLIIGILIAIALPTFFGARARASERSAQSLIRTSIAAAKVSFSDDGNYLAVSPATLDAIDTSVTYNTGPSVVGEVSIRDVSATTLLLVSTSSTGDVFCLAEDTNNGFMAMGRDTSDSFVTIADCPVGGW